MTPAIYILLAIGRCCVSPESDRPTIVYDLGSGDGRIVNIAVLEYGARGVGIEIVPSLVETSKQVAKQAGVGERATFIDGIFSRSTFPQQQS